MAGKIRRIRVKGKGVRCVQKGKPGFVKCPKKLGGKAARRSKGLKGMHCVKQVKRRIKGHWRKVCTKFARGR